PNLGSGKRDGGEPPGGRSTQMAAASPTYTPACTHCRRACARCAAYPAQIPGAKISVCHGVAGTLAASGTIIMSDEPLSREPPLRRRKTLIDWPREQRIPLFRSPCSRVKDR